MRIALFTPYLPLPAVTGGRIRVARLAEGLGAVGEIVLFATGRPSRLRDPEVRRLHDAWFAATYSAVSPWSLLPFRTRPARVVRCDAGRLRRAFAREQGRRAFDVAVVEHGYAAPIALDSGLPVVIDEHNVESRFHEASAAARGAGDSRAERARFVRWEDRAWKAARRVVAVSEADREAILARAPGASVEVVPNGVDCRALPFAPPSARAATKAVLFVALFSHPPNVRAAERLVRRIMPRVWAQEPEARLVLCGHAPRPEVRALAGARVEVTGSVPSVAPRLAAARVIVNPLEHGAGTSLKVLEALASGAPLVTTRVGLRGWPEDAHALCDVADDDDTFAARVLGALRSSGAALDDRAAAGRAFAERYDWPRLASRFAALVEASAA